MNSSLRGRGSCALLALAAITAVVWGGLRPCFGQTGPAPSAAQPSLGPYRQLAPGVMVSIDPFQEAKETVSRHDVVELLAVDPAFDWAKDAVFRRDIWCLRFSFKPVRLIWADVPQPSGKMQRKPIWYMVYSVTNQGKAFHPTADKDGTYKVVETDKAVRFVPEFLLVSTDPGITKAYPDRVIPVALGPIRSREDPSREFATSVDIARDINVGETVWGVAMWEDVDPRIDRFAVYVTGLTNAYRWSDADAEGQPGSYKFKPGDPIGTGRRLARKTLKLNFWRPGDENYENEPEVRYGVPGEVDYEWVYQ